MVGEIEMEELLIFVAAGLSGIENDLLDQEMLQQLIHLVGFYVKRKREQLSPASAAAAAVVDVDVVVDSNSRYFRNTSSSSHLRSIKKN